MFGLSHEKDGAALDREGKVGRGRFGGRLELSLGLAGMSLRNPCGVGRSSKMEGVRG